MKKTTLAKTWYYLNIQV